MVPEMVREAVGDLELEAEHGGGERLAVIVEREAARDAAAQGPVRDEIERAERVDRVALDLASDDAGVEGFEALGGELILQIRVELGVVGDHRDVRDVA